jgi:periplasmic divalent cation tolerance protein
MEARFLYVTASSADEAKRLARALVEERLVACANVLDGATSFYWWEGAVQESGEALLIAKTRADRVDAVVDRVTALHSYSCPCVVALPILAGNPDYLAWIEEEAALR